MPSPVELEVLPDDVIVAEASVAELVRPLVVDAPEVSALPDPVELSVDCDVDP